MEHPKRPTWPTDLTITPENAATTFTVGFNQFVIFSESESGDLRDGSKPGICFRSKAITAFGELHALSLGSSGFDLRSFPVLIS